MLLVGRPPSFIAFGARLIAQLLNYSGNIVGLTSDVFGLRKQSPSLPLFSSVSSRPSTQPTTYRQVQPNLSRQPAALLARASENCPGPDPSSCHRRVRIIPKHLQNVSVFSFGLPSLFFLTVRLRSEGRISPYPKILLLYICETNPKYPPRCPIALPPPLFLSPCNALDAAISPTCRSTT